MELSYPIGKFDWTTRPTPGTWPQLIGEIADAPALVRKAVDGLDDSQPDTPYSPGGWTVRQVVHHLADSHINSYIRLRLALTEEEPIIKPYDEKLWAGLHDAWTLPIEPSLQLLDTLHHRWV